MSDSCSREEHRFNLIFICQSQVRAAVEALRNVHGLPWQTVKDCHPRARDLDCFDWLQDMFGFQVCFLFLFVELCIVLRIMLI